MLLPLNELQGEFRGLVGKSVLRQQLQTGKMNMPSISSTLKDTGVVEFSLEEPDEAYVNEAQACDKEANTSTEVDEISEQKASTVNSECDVSVANITIANVTIHEPPKETYDTSF